MLEIPHASKVNVEARSTANDTPSRSLAVERASNFTFDACGISNMEPLEVDCEPVVDVSENQTVSDNTLQLPFPNPFTNQLWIPGLADATSAAKPISVRILNSIGQVVDRMTIPATGALWNAEDQPDGIYFIHSIPSESPSGPMVVTPVIKSAMH